MVIPGIGDSVHGLDVTGLEVRGEVIAVRSVTNAKVGPFAGGPVVVLDVYDVPAPLVALVRFYEIKDCRRHDRPDRTPNRR
jgi:hypothetical protein